MIISMEKFVDQGEEWPRFYGLAYWSPNYFAVCYPVPINLIVRLWHKIEWWHHKYIKRGDWLESPFHEAFACGLKEGRQRVERQAQDDARRELESDPEKLIKVIMSPNGMKALKGIERHRTVFWQGT